MEGPKGPGPQPFAALGSLPVPVHLGRLRVSPAIQPREAPPYNRGKARRRRHTGAAERRCAAAAAAPPCSPLPPHTPLRSRAVEAARTALRRATGAAGTPAPSGVATASSSPLSLTRCSAAGLTNQIRPGFHFCCPGQGHDRRVTFRGACETEPDSTSGPGMDPTVTRLTLLETKTGHRLVTRPARSDARGGRSSAAWTSWLFLGRHRPSLHVGRHAARHSLAPTRAIPYTYDLI